MATGQLTATPAVFHLPITGRRNGKNRVVVGHAIVLDDEFTHTVLAKRFWSFAAGKYLMNALGKRGARNPVYLHRLIFEHYHGPVPDGLEIDHADRNTLNNLPSNLRAVTSGQNNANRGMKRNNKSGFVGVHWAKKIKRWIAQVGVKGQSAYRGCFRTREEAAVAVNRAYAEHYPHIPPPNPTVAF